MAEGSSIVLKTPRPNLLHTHTHTHQSRTVLDVNRFCNVPGHFEESLNIT